MILSHSFLQTMLKHISHCCPEEACGMIGGYGETATAVLPITNELHSPHRFRMAAEEQLNAFLFLEENKWDLIAIYHSHPEGPDHPSATDLAEFAYPGTQYLIWYRLNGSWEVKAYILDNRSFAEIEIVRTLC